MQKQHFLGTAVGGALIGQITNAIIDGLIKSPSIPVSRAEATVIKPEVREAVAQEVAPVIEHLTNNEPWYQSRVTWGAIISAGSPLVSVLLGRAFTQEEQMLATAVMTGVGSAIGAGIVLYGRWKARKPIGA